MAWVQIITPSPGVPCRPGWCLTYLDDCFNLEAHGKTKNYPSATAAWKASRYQHKDRNFPAGCWVPVYFTLSDNEDGHVALLAPDGTVWSSSHPTSNKPVHHKSLDDLDTYYGRGRLGFLGWTEDLTDILAIKKEEDMITKDNIWLARLVNAEAKGWNRDDVYGGKLDENELKAWIGKTWEDFLRDAAGHKDTMRFGEQKAIWLKAYLEQDGLKKQLAAALAAKTGPVSVSESDKKLQAIKDALDIK